jgi:hypothetical protein
MMHYRSRTPSSSAPTRSSRISKRRKLQFKSALQILVPLITQILPDYGVILTMLTIFSTLCEELIPCLVPYGRHIRTQVHPTLSHGQGKTKGLFTIWQACLAMKLARYLNVESPTPLSCTGPSIMETTAFELLLHRVCVEMDATVVV